MTTNGVNSKAASAHVTVDEFIKTDFDYVVCGGGTAGLVVAARLTENPDVTVGVIEAGKNKLDDPLVDIPTAFPMQFSNPEYDWAYKTTPQKGNRDTVHHFVRGKMLGGSSGINYMMYVVGHCKSLGQTENVTSLLTCTVQDYDDWAELVGDESWSSTHMMKYMRKHRTLEPFDEKVNDPKTHPLVAHTHGDSGPIRTGFNDNSLPIDADFIKAADQVTGLTKKPLDPYSGDHIGFYNTLGSVYRSGPHKGKRSYAARGYFEENQGRPNLKLITESLVAKVVIADGVATGVEFMTDGKKHTVMAKKEVVVSGGVIGSPQILELSGIGDPEVLKAAGVDCLVDLPGVGNNLQDHIITRMNLKLAPGLMSGDSMQKPEMMAALQKAFAETSGGGMTNYSPVQGYFPIKWALKEDELEDVVKSIENMTGGTEFARRQREQQINHIRSDKSGSMQFVLAAATTNPSREAIEDQSKVFTGADLSEPDGITMVLCYQYPVSRGSTHIRSADPAEYPVIDPNYLGEEADVKLLAAGLKWADNVCHNEALKEKLGKRILPKPEYHMSKSSDRMEAIRDMVAVRTSPC